MICFIVLISLSDMRLSLLENISSSSVLLNTMMDIFFEPLRWILSVISDLRVFFKLSKQLFDVIWTFLKDKF